MRALALLLLAGTALAQTPPPIKPGLWEMKPLSMEVDGKPMPSMGQMGAQLAQLPPEVRKQMEERMKAQGVAMGDGGAVRVCVSQDMLNRNEWGQGQRDQQDCRVTVGERSANRWTWSVQCKSGQGQGTTEFRNAEAYRSEVRWSGQHHGRSSQMHSVTEARWLGADCGGLPPRGR